MKLQGKCGLNHSMKKTKANYATVIKYQYIVSFCTEICAHLDASLKTIAAYTLTKF